MKIPKLKTPYAVLPVVIVPFVGHLDGHPFFTAACFVFTFIWDGWVVASFVTDGEYIGSGISRHEKKLLKRRRVREQKIRQLEEIERKARNGESFEPLDLAWPEGLLQELAEHYEKKDKEKP